MNKIQHNTPDIIINFWFKELKPQQWWDKSDKLDLLIESQFGTLHRSAHCCELYSWRETALGRLAEVIILDQFSRNIYRDHPQAFAYDGIALALAQTAIGVKADHELDSAQRAFLYMPYMHSESQMIHTVAFSLFSQSGMADNLVFELKHKAIIDRFGRYPHRNNILGRASTPEELDFLKTPGSSF